VLIIGAGGVAHAAAHKCAQYNTILGDINIASRTQNKCDAIIKSIYKKDSLRDNEGKINSFQVDALNKKDLVELIKKTKSSIVINLGTAFINMSVLDACIEANVDYIDTAIHEDPMIVCEDPPWYANYEWKKKSICAGKGINVILGAGFDPGVVNAYSAYAKRYCFSNIDTIDIIDINNGTHNKFFATNFDPEINFREFTSVWAWIDRQWKSYPAHTIKKEFYLPEVGIQTAYLTGHDEIHSLYKNIYTRNICFWMGFSDHYLNVFNTLNKIGLLSHKPFMMPDGNEIIPLKLIKAILPDPLSLAPEYTGKTCIGCNIKGTNNGKKKELFIYNICDHKKCYEEIEAQAISYTAGVPPVAAAILIAQSLWKPGRMVNVEELSPVPFIKLLNLMGLKTNIIEKTECDIP
jgi:saccharopine dehydrogenase-like NADP-dependent oxidoreductase